MGSLFHISTLVLLAVIVMAVYIGYKKGLIRILFSLVATVLTIILSSLLFQPVNDFLTSQTTLQENVSEIVQEHIEETTGEKLSQIKQSAQASFLKKVPLPSVVTNYLIEHNNKEGYQSQGVSNFASYVSSVAALFIVRVIGFLVTFIIVRLLLSVVLSLLHVVEFVPGVKSVNHTGGAILVLAELLVILWLVCALAAGMSGTLLGGFAEKAINDNLILGFLYRHNLLLSLLSGALGF